MNWSQWVILITCLWILAGLVGALIIVIPMEMNDRHNQGYPDDYYEEVLGEDIEASDWSDEVHPED